MLIEPYWSPCGKLFYKKFHPEPYNDKAKEWKFDSTGAWSGANQALSYLILKRDRKLFRKNILSDNVYFWHSSFVCAKKRKFLRSVA